MSEEPKTKKTFLDLLMRLVFIVAPTIAVGYKMLDYLGDTFTAFNMGIGWLSLYFGIAITVSYSLYFFRARVIVTFLLLWITYSIINLVIKKIPGEFDMFFYLVEFHLYSLVFVFGWIFGFVLARWKNGFILTSAIFTGLILVAVAQWNIDSDHFDLRDYNAASPERYFILWNLLPVFVYALYMYFFAPPLARSIDSDFQKTKRIFFRFIPFLILIVLAFILSLWYFKDEIKAAQSLAEYVTGQKDGNGGGGDENGNEKGQYDEKNGLLEKGNHGDKEGGDNPGGKKPKEGDDGYKLKDTMKMNDKMSQADYLMFCAKVKNFFPDGSPKPLYFVYHYLTKYDPVAESFIRDSAMPKNDELRIDPSELAMYRSKTDSVVIKNCYAKKKRVVVESQVYISSKTWQHALLAPASAFFCQSIPVDSSYKKMFRSGYRVKSYTSDLNNAYFVYNPSANPQLEEYQQERFNELRTVKDYTNIDSAFYVYYTQMPKGVLYDSINELAKRITKDAVTPIDKVIAVRDYFLQKDKEGNRIYRYSLKAGAPSDPNIPNSSMLRNFLFKTHTGYCTYFAGASLFLLRCAGVPARFTTGFATIDRSDKNKGWYWFYASQAHAWTQVYFPGYGWLDFDMTIGNEDQKEAPRPDGTPPLPPPEPWLVIEGKASADPDMKSKHLSVDFNKIIFFNDDYNLNKTFSRDVDASVCRVLYDKKDTTLAAIHAGDSIIVVSYDDAAKKIPQPRTGVSIENQVEDFPKPIVADEIHVKPKPEEEKKEPEKKKKQNDGAKEMTWGQVFVILGIIVGSLLLLLFLFPTMWFWWLAFRARAAKEPKSKADRVYRLALYDFHMAGMERGFETPLEYAETKVDPFFNTNFREFMLIYLRLKYSGGNLMNGDTETINSFGKSIHRSVKNKIGFFPVILNYFRLIRANHYFRRPEESETLNENPEQKNSENKNSEQ